MKRPLRGLYAITDSQLLGEGRLLPYVEAALKGGARLLQYRAFKGAAAWFAERLGGEGARHPRSVPVDERHRVREPELVWTVTAADFAALAASALSPREAPSVRLDHLHAPRVSLREQAAIVVSMLRAAGTASFRELVAGETETGVVVARFIAVLELFRRAAVSFEQVEPLGELILTWTAAEWDDAALDALGAEYDD